MRCLFNTAAKDVRRFRLYEKSLDALATSPYARTVDRWLLAGMCLLGRDFARVPHSEAWNSTISKPTGQVISLSNRMLDNPLNVGGVATGLGNGARVAAVVAGRCRGHVAGCCLLSYPLLVCQPTTCASACLHISRGHHSGHAGAGAHSFCVPLLNISNVNSTDVAKVLRLTGGSPAHKAEQSCQAGPGTSCQATRLCEPQAPFHSCSHFPPMSNGHAIYSGLH